jgi:hypothetical protein
MEKLRDMDLDEREWEIFSMIERATIEGKQMKDISILDDDVVILDRWKGRLAHKIAQVI